MTTPYDDLVARATADVDVLGLVLSGSKAREGMETANSDADVYVIVPEYDGAWSRAKRSAQLDEIPYTLTDLRDVSDRWQRYSFRCARVLLDRLDGGIADLVHAQATLTAAEADAWVREYLDGYVNFIYRATKSRRDGRDDLAALDDIEAVPWFLWTLFALYGRVRPYNKYLRWELETYPLPPPWTIGHLLPALAQRPVALFADLETAARAKGFGDVFDAWGDGLEVIRADA